MIKYKDYISFKEITFKMILIKINLLRKYFDIQISNLRSSLNQLIFFKRKLIFTIKFYEIPM